jgi:hypothetical protein
LGCIALILAPILFKAYILFGIRDSLWWLFVLVNFYLNSAGILHQFLLTKVLRQIGSLMYKNLFASDQTLLNSALLSAESSFESVLSILKTLRKVKLFSTSNCTKFAYLYNFEQRYCYVGAILQKNFAFNKFLFSNSFFSKTIETL